MNVVDIKYIGNDYGGNNLLFIINLDKEEINLDNIEEKLFFINNSQRYDFQWYTYLSYGNMDYNGIFFETIYIDKEDCCHKINDGKVIITDNFICEIILDELRELIKEINEGE